MLVFTSRPPRLLDLPFDILSIIISTFSEHDMIHFGMTCFKFRQLSLNPKVWRLMYENRFTTNRSAIREADPSISWKDYYCKKACLIRSIEREFSMRDRYEHSWETVMTKESVFGSTLITRTGTNIMISGSIDSVPPGTYKVQWRMRAHEKLRRSHNLTFRTSLQLACDFSTRDTRYR
ncbi:hypothetical protein CLU79DRAFT_15983 [Phycomyces nitens]|nr:hypothetical protein CLU79DRAFT_15983 [Phycomyces nitens]